MQGADLVKTGMVAQRHLDDFTECCWVNHWFCHKSCFALAALKVKLPAPPKPPAQSDALAPL